MTYGDMRVVAYAAMLLACGCSAANDENIQDVPTRPVEAPGNDANLGREQPNACGSSSDRNLANLAAATAEELGRWQVATDFQLTGDGLTLELSAEGASRCRNGCLVVRATLELQKPEARTADHAPDEFASALASGWARQKAARADGPGSTDHQLTRIAVEPAQCGSMFWFEAERSNCSGDCDLVEPEALRHELLFAGFPRNPYLQFQSALDFGGRQRSVVGIDPTYGPGGDDNTSSGSCVAACTIISSSNLQGACCSCNGVVRSLQRSVWSVSTYLCK